MSLHIDYIFEMDAPLSNEEKNLIAHMLEYTMQLEGRTTAEISITFCDQSRIRELNRLYRGIDSPTDVLSFPLEEEKWLGDIIISVPQAIKQAEEFGHSFERELYFLIVHGFLHLLGYDHEMKEQEQIMFAKQELILSHMGINR